MFKRFQVTERSVQTDNVMRVFTAFVAFLLLSIVAVVPVSAQAPGSLGFQGYLTNTSGEPLDSTGVVMTFRLYKGAAAVWQDTHHVNVSRGVFNVLLGKNVPLDTVAFNQNIDLSIKLLGEDPMRAPLVAGAYARALPWLYTFYREDTGGLKGINVIGGMHNNTVGADITGATIFGGGISSGGTDFGNTVTGEFGTVSGGLANTAQGRRSVVGGGYGNVALGDWSTVGGGVRNEANGLRSVVGGGNRNIASGDSSTVAGGAHGTASGLASTVSGGTRNTASGENTTVAGGDWNTANGDNATVGGGFFNTASGLYATVPGGRSNRATKGYTFAAGWEAQAIHSGTFVWADSSTTFPFGIPFPSTDENQFLIRATGGVGIGTNSPGNQLTVAGDADITGK
ncbi:hypothetical protein ACFLRO_02115, partial [Bacteroidota bacterium]